MKYKVINILGIKLKFKIYQKLSSINFLSHLKYNNKILGSVPKLINSKIIFEGCNNVLYCDKDVILKNSTIRFLGNNSLIFLNSCSHYKIKCNIATNCVVYFGRNNSFNKEPLEIACTEHNNIFIGEDNQFSYGICLRNSDAHRIFDINSKKRINYSKSIYIGNHNWIGQDCMILKGTRIHSGCVIGAKSLVAGKNIDSNSIYAGNPIKKIRDNIFWDRDCVHHYNETDTNNKSTLDKINLPDNIEFSVIEDFFNSDNSAITDKITFLSNLFT